MSAEAIVADDDHTYDLAVRNTAIVVFRLAEQRDVAEVARLFQISSGGVADYIWSGLQSEYPGKSILEIGEARYARTDQDFSFENCHMALCRNKPVGMMHAYPMGNDVGKPPSDIDPVLRPYFILEQPNSLYISSIAVDVDMRGQGIGTRFINIAAGQARKMGLKSLSLICFEANHRAMALYQRLEFREVAREAIVAHDMIAYSGDAVLMALEL